MTVITEISRQPQLNAPDIEYVPSFYLSAHGPEQAQMSPDELLLFHLGQEYLYNPDKAALLRSACGVAQHFADTELVLASADPDTMERVLAVTRGEELMVRHFSLTTSLDIMSYDPRTQTVMANEYLVERAVNTYTNYFKYAGVKPKHLLDPAILVYINRVGHEVGHAKLDSLSRLIEAGEIGPALRSDHYPLASLASHLYSQIHRSRNIDTYPNLAASTVEESAAEGYGALAAKRMLATRGYTETEIAQLLNQIHLGATVRWRADIGSNDTHQIDLLGDPEAMNALLELRGGREYLGKLGYGIPFDAAELNGLLRELGPIALGNIAVEGIDEYLKSVSDLPDTPPQQPAITSYVDSLRTFRQEALRQKRDGDSALPPLRQRLLHRMQRARELLHDSKAHRYYGRRAIAATLIGAIYFTLGPTGIAIETGVAAQTIEHPGRKMPTGPHVVVNGTKVPVGEIPSARFVTTKNTSKYFR